MRNAKFMVNFEISGLDYVGLILKIDHYGLLGVKNRAFPVLTRNAWADQKVMVIFEISGFDYVCLILKIDR